MRIVSDFHDYYDVVQATGQDQTVVYTRTKKEVELNQDSFPFPIFGRISTRFDYYSRYDILLMQIVVGFCGKVYPVLRLSHQRQAEPNPTFALCYSLPEVDTFFEHHFKRHEIDAYHLKRKRYSWSSAPKRATFEEFYATYTAKQSAFGQFFMDSRCPIFVASTWWEAGPRNYIRKYKVVYNDFLKELEFFRIMDTFTAYQELQMYFGAMAQPNKPIPEISDKDMVSIKGFDKWSFRKPPSH
jgi:hypothetical protein